MIRYFLPTGSPVAHVVAAEHAAQPFRSGLPARFSSQCGVVSPGTEMVSVAKLCAACAAHQRRTTKTQPVPRTP